MNTYVWNAEDYEKYSHAQQLWARELIDKLNLHGTEHVLDLGCGDGKVTAEIASAVASGFVIGVDNSAEMIELATARYSSTAHSNLSFQVMDASALSFDACFDTVFSNAALHWVKNHRPVIAGVFRSLRPGGKILLQMGGEGNAAEILEVLTEIQLLPEWCKYFKNYEFPYGFLGVEDYQALLLEAGFIVNRVQLIPKDMQHDGKSGLEGWLRTTWLPYTSRIPDERKADFVDAIITRYLAKVPITFDGKSHVAMVRLEVEARKPM